MYTFINRQNSIFYPNSLEEHPGRIMFLSLWSFTTIMNVYSSVCWVLGQKQTNEQNCFNKAEHI